jgi:4-hydroxyphenylpyruvate dioxygenase
MNTWVKFYEEVMGFVNFLSLMTNKSTEYSALMSKVMSNGNGRIKFPINEPAEGKKNHKSRYLDFMVDRGYNILPSQLMISLKISQLKARG